MLKTWEQMTDKEKIEDLRRDMKNIMDTVNVWIENQRQLGQLHNDLMKKVSEVSEAVRILTARTT